MYQSQKDFGELRKVARIREKGIDKSGQNNRKGIEKSGQNKRKEIEKSSQNKTLVN